MLKTGEYFGNHYKKIVLNNCIITDTEYIHERVDWHHHQNPYFTYILRGELFEANKKESYCLESGDLVFHNWQDPHYNLKSEDYTRGFHIELNQDWFKSNDIDIQKTEGSFKIDNVYIKSLVNSLFVESKIGVIDEVQKASFEFLLFDIYSSLSKADSNLSHSRKKPIWIKKLTEIMHSNEFSDLSAKQLSKRLNVHYVHLSREFHRYFGMSFSRYSQLIKLNRSISLLMSEKHTLTEVAHACGFYDQSHFTTCFKLNFGLTPSKFLKKAI